MWRLCSNTFCCKNRPKNGHFCHEGTKIGQKSGFLKTTKSPIQKVKLNNANWLLLCHNYRKMIGELTWELTPRVCVMTLFVAKKGQKTVIFAIKTLK